MNDINQILLNPIRSRVIQYLAQHQKATTGEMSSIMIDIPKTTLYRHLKILVENNIITVIEENKVRGSVEKTYALNVKSIQDKNTSENALSNAFGFLMKIYGDFASYYSKEEHKTQTDNVFLSNVSLLLSDEEFNELLKELNKLLLEHLNNKPSENRRQRSLSIISSPVVKKREK